MGPITLENVRASSDITVKLRLKDGGMYIAWTSLADIKAYIFSDAQRAIAGRCDVSIDGDDSTMLICTYSANKPQYLGVNSIVIRANYDGRVKTYDRRAFNIVKRTSAVSGDVVLDDPVVDLELEVADVSSSLLDMAIALAFKAVEEWDQVTVTERGPEGKSAYRVAVDNGFVGTEEEWLESLVGPEGPRGRQGVQGETGPAGVSSAEVVIDESTGEPHAEISVINGLLRLVLSGIKGEQGIQGPQGIQGIQGPQGIQGETGPKGEDGDAGEPGEPGPQGERGPAGVTSAVVSVSNTTGNPSATASVENGVLSIAISGIKGETGPQGEQGIQGVQGPQGVQGETGPQGPQGLQGNTGSSVDYPFELVNNRKTDDATKALSAAEGKRLGEDIDLNDISKLDKKPGINLYDSSARELKKLSNDGTAATNSSWMTSAYILVDENTEYCLHKKGSALGSSGNICFYDISKSFIGYTAADSTTFTTPANCRYLRFGNTKAGDVNTQLEVGSVAHTYEPFDVAYGYLHDIKETVTNKVDIDCGHNLFDINAVVVGLLGVTGGVNTNQTAWRTSDYMKIEAEQSYYASAKGDAAIYTGGSPAYFGWYDKAKGFISSVAEKNTKAITAPSGAAYLRLTFQPATEEIMVEKGSARSTNYEVFSPIAGHVPIIRNKQVKARHLDDALVEKLNSRSSFSRMHGNETLAAGETISLDPCHVKKNVLLVARISGTIGNVAVGLGVPDADYGSCFVEIEPTKVSLWQRFSPTPTKVTEYDHGLTLTTDTTVEIETVLNSTSVVTTLRLYDGNGNIFEQELSYWGFGRPYAKNNNDSDSVDVDLSFFPMDIRARIWLFGDSYVNLVSNDRWPYYLVQKGMANWLVNSLAGQSGSSAYSDLQSLLALGAVPTFLVWTLGMNGDSDTLVDEAYVIAPTQKTVIDNVVAVCTNAGITPVFATVPTVPTRQKTGLCNYVKSLGYRYIDFADAVGTDSTGAWKTGLLSNDGVHPTVAGAKVLSSRALLDFPEFSINFQ